MLYTGWGRGSQRKKEGSAKKEKRGREVRKGRCVGRKIRNRGRKEEQGEKRKMCREGKEEIGEEKGDERRTR
jgi:hypothetical protein